MLVDPWLVGDLQFFEQGWLYTGKKRNFGGASGIKVDLQSIAEDTDVILITQARVPSPPVFIRGTAEAAPCTIVCS